MTDNTQPEALRLANALEYCDASVARQAINELRRLHVELETLRTGYAAARLEIESLKAQLHAAHPSHEHQRAIMEGERNASLDAYSRVVSITSAESRLYERAFTNGWCRRASHGQAPAQPEVVPECHYGPLRDADAEWGKQLSVYATLPRAADTQQAPAQAQMLAQP